MGWFFKRRDVLLTRSPGSVMDDPPTFLADQTPTDTTNPCAEKSNLIGPIIEYRIVLNHVRRNAEMLKMYEGNNVK